MSVVLAVLLLAGVCQTLASQPAAASTRSGCTPRILVLSAMPVELGPLLAQEKSVTTLPVGNRDAFVGSLRGHDVVLALTGIGPVNARHSTRALLDRFRCGDRSGISAIVFSGVAGGDYIGDVIIPTQWTSDAGRHFYGVDKRLLAAVRRASRSHVTLEQKAAAGDPACGCATDPDLVKPVTVTHRPRIEIGGKGQTTDPFSGRALPCIPAGGDVFGCEPCPEQKKLLRDGRNFASGIAPFLNPDFFTGYFSATSTESGKYVTEDEETAAVDAVAHHHRIPFLGIRAVSDGGGDPLHLPGFPFEFFVYRQIAADNAAHTTLATLADLHQ